MAQYRYNAGAGRYQSNTTGRFASPSLGVVVSANITAFQQGMGQLPGIVQSAIAQAGQHISAFNNLIQNSIGRIAGFFRSSFGRIGQFFSGTLDAIRGKLRGYFGRTRVDDLGIPELAGIFNPSKFDLQMNRVTSSLARGFGRIRTVYDSFRTYLTSKVRGYFGRGTGDDLGIPELLGLSRFGERVNQVTGTLSTGLRRIRGVYDSFASYMADRARRATARVRGYFGAGTGDDLGIPELAGISRFGERVNQITASLSSGFNRLRDTFQSSRSRLLSLAQAPLFGRAARAVKGYFTPLGATTEELGMLGVPGIGDLAGIERQFPKVISALRNFRAKLAGIFTKQPAYAEDLGIPELAILNPSVIGRVVNSATTRIQSVASRIRDIAARAIRWPSGYFGKGTGDDLGIPELFGISRFEQQFPRISRAFTRISQIGQMSMTDIYNAAKNTVTRIPTMFTSMAAKLSGTTGIGGALRATAAAGGDLAVGAVPGLFGIMGTAMKTVPAGLNAVAAAFNNAFGPTPFMAALSNANRFFNGLLGHIFNVRTALIGLSGFFLVRWGKNLASSFIEAGSEMQQFKLQLDAIFKGSVPLAEETLRKLIKFARETPFSTQSSVRAFNILASAGFEATDETLQALGKLAFTFRRTLEEVARDFVSQRLQSLHTFGIHIERWTDRVAVMMGDQIRIVRNSRDQVVKALTEVVNNTLPGLTEKALNTWVGVVEYFDSLWWEIRARIGQGILKDIQPKLLEFGRIVEDMMLKGKFNKIGDALGSIFTSVMDKALREVQRLVDWLVDLDPKEIDDFFGRVRDNILGFYEAAKGFLGPIARWVGDLIKLFDSLPSWVKEVGIITALLFGPGLPLALVAGADLLKKYVGIDLVGWLTEGMSNKSLLTKSTAPGGTTTTAAAENPFATVESTNAWLLKQFPPERESLLGRPIEVLNAEREKQKERDKQITEAQTSLVGNTTKLSDAAGNMATSTDKASSALDKLVAAMGGFVGAVIGYRTARIPGAAAGALMGMEGFSNIKKQPAAGFIGGVAGVVAGLIPGVGWALGGPAGGAYIGSQLFATMEEKGIRQKIKDSIWAYIYKVTGAITDAIKGAPVSEPETVKNMVMFRSPRGGTLSMFDKEIYDVIKKWAEKTGVPLARALAMAHVESTFNPKAVSPAGAKGLFQVMPDTARQPGYGIAPLPESKIFDIEENTRFGLQYRSKMAQLFGSIGSLGAYNAGPGAYGRGEITPETIKYMQDVLEKEKQYIWALSEGIKLQKVRAEEAKKAAKTIVNATEEQQKAIDEYQKGSIAAAEEQDRVYALEEGRRAYQERLATRTRQQMKLQVDRELKDDIQRVQKQTLNQIELLSVVGLRGEALMRVQGEQEKLNAIEQVNLKINEIRNETVLKSADVLNQEAQILKENTGVRVNFKEVNGQIEQTVSDLQNLMLGTNQQWHAMAAGIKDATEAEKENIRVTEETQNAQQAGVKAGQYTFRVLAQFYDTLTAAKIAVARASALYQVYQQEKDSLDIWNQQVDAAMATTAEEKAQVAINQKLLDLRIAGVNITEQQEKKLISMLSVYEKMKAEAEEILRHHQEYSQEIQQSISSIGDTLANSFGKLTDMLTQKGKKDWKGFIRDILQEIKGSVDQALASTAKALFAQFIKDMTDSFPSEIIKKWGDELANIIYGKVPKIPKTDIEILNKTLEDMQKENQEAAKFLRDLMTKQKAASDELMRYFDSNSPVVKALKEVVEADKDLAAALRGQPSPTSSATPTTPLPTNPYEGYGGTVGGYSIMGGTSPYSILGPKEPNASIIPGGWGGFGPELQPSFPMPEISAPQAAMAAAMPTATVANPVPVAVVNQAGLNYPFNTEIGGVGGYSILGGTSPYSILGGTSPYSVNAPTVATEQVPNYSIMGSGGWGGFAPTSPPTQYPPNATPPFFPDKNQQGGMLESMLPMMLPMIMSMIMGGGKGKGSIGPQIAIMAVTSLVGIMRPKIFSAVKDGISDGAKDGAKDAIPAIQELGGETQGIFGKAIGSIGSMFVNLFSGLGSMLQSLTSGLGIGGPGGLASIFGPGGGLGSIFSGIPILGSIFGSGGLFSGLFGGGWGSAPAGMMGPTMAGGGFFSNPLGAILSFFGFETGGLVTNSRVMGAGVKYNASLDNFVAPYMPKFSFGTGGAVPIMAHPDEYVINANTVRGFGRHNMAMVNAGVIPDNMPRRAGVYSHTVGDSGPSEPPNVHVEFKNITMMDPAKMGYSKDDIINIWVEDCSGKGGRTRNAVKEIVGR